MLRVGGRRWQSAKRCKRVAERILVTGATGLIGAELVRQLSLEGASIRVLRRTASSMDVLGGVAQAVEHAIGDITDRQAVWEAMEGISQVYHVAAYLGFGGARDREQLRQVNVAGTAYVVDAALDRGVTRLVHTSSHAAFGRTQVEGVIDERTLWSDSPYNSPYAYSKYLAELEVQRGVAEGLDAVIVNPSLVFGVGARGHVTRSIAERIRDRRMPFVPVGGANVVDVRDVAKGLRLAMTKGQCGERYFLGSENLHWQDLFQALAAAFHVPPPTRLLAPNMAERLGGLAEVVAKLTWTKPRLTRTSARVASKFYTYDNTKAQTELGLAFRPFSETAQYLAEALRR